MCHWKIILLSILVVSMSVFHCMDAASLHCYKGALDNYDVYPLPLTNTQILNPPCYYSNRSTAACVGGYMSEENGPFLTAMLLALLELELNVMRIDWDEEAASGPLGPQLSYALSAVPNAKIVGNYVGEAISMMVQDGLDASKVHLIGHSLGAHLAAFAGTWAKDKGHTIQRITGLDGARTGFEGPFGIQGGINPVCAHFVDIIHSDTGAGGYGITRSAGTADFYPNNRGRAKQPGCPKGTFKMFSDEDLCSHNRSWQMYVESMGSPTAFPAASAPDYDAWARDPARWTNIAYMGYWVNTSASGNYFLTTGATSPYGLGLQGLTPNASQTSG